MVGIRACKQLGDVERSAGSQQIAKHVQGEPIEAGKQGRIHPKLDRRSIVGHIRRSDGHGTYPKRRTDTAHRRTGHGGRCVGQKLSTRISRGR